MLATFLIMFNFLIPLMMPQKTVVLVQEQQDALEKNVENFSKERTVIVGDSLTSDIAGGINFGIDTCWYNPKGKTAPADMSDKITYIASEFSAVKSIIMQGETE